MISWSSGCRIEVALAGENINFTLQNSASESDEALSRINKIFDLYDP